MHLSMKQRYIAIIGLLCLLLTGCATRHSNKNAPAPHLQVTLRPYQGSDFKQVEATFVTQQSRALVFRVLSNIAQTSQWFEQVESVEVLTVYNNHQYLLRTVIHSPWPFKNRELITCVDTSFEAKVTVIKVSSCSDKIPIHDALVRLLAIESTWKIRELGAAITEVTYTAWLDPAGAVPAFLFNQQLLSNTQADLIQLHALIEQATVADYPYY